MFDGEREILERTLILKQWLKLSGVPGITLSLYRLTRVEYHRLIVCPYLCNFLEEVCRRYSIHSVWPNLEML